jgi:hypothetical protein
MHIRIFYHNKAPKIGRCRLNGHGTHARATNGVASPRKCYLGMRYGVYVHARTNDSSALLTPCSGIAWAPSKLYLDRIAYLEICALTFMFASMYTKDVNIGHYIEAVRLASFRDISRHHHLMDTHYHSMGRLREQLLYNDVENPFDLVMYDPGPAANGGPDLCWPPGATTWWLQNNLGRAHVTTIASLGPIVCPAAYTIAGTSSVIGAGSTYIACCPSYVLRL